MKAKFLVPLIAFVLLVGFLYVGLHLNPREVPSPLIGKPAPAFELAQLHATDKTLSSADMQGQVWLLNVWASWCAACRDEHPILVELAKQKVLPMVGLNYKDERQPALDWLREHGDPYTTSIVDADGRVGINYGVYGVPETFIIDKQGRIVYKHIGPVTPRVMQEKLLPKIKEAQSA